MPRKGRPDCGGRVVGSSVCEWESFLRLFPLPTHFSSPSHLQIITQRHRQAALGQRPHGLFEGADAGEQEAVRVGDVGGGLDLCGE